MMGYFLSCRIIMSLKPKNSPTAKPTANRRSKVLPELNKKDLGNLIPRRGGKLAPKIGHILMKSAGWKTVGSIPNISQAVVLAVPHTSNIDGLYALPCLFALDRSQNQYYGQAYAV